MAMTGMRQLTTGLDIVDQVPPEAIINQKAPDLLAQVPQERRQAVVELVHWAYGAAGGALYGVLPESWRKTVWSGPLYGLGAWTMFEAGLAPVLGLKQARESRVDEQIMFAIDHLIYGAIVGSMGSQRN